jgi:hypothetical protein
MSTVLGRPVTGEITTYRENRVAQKPGKELLPLLDAILTLENVEAVRWTQYTPYFNDGEACLFGTGEVTVKLVDGDDTAGDEEDGYISTYEMFNDSRLGRYNDPSTVNPGFEDLYSAVQALTREFEHFEDFLLEAFGDHAQVTATTEGFDVAFYEHD